VPLQNRVTPRGDIVATPARGTLMGNRGRLHDERRRLVRRVVGGYRAWVTCVLDFKGRRRTVMRPGRYTELFFLDEATALAAGHRPCGECRRADFQRFKEAWTAGNPEHGLAASTPIARIDLQLHRDRLSPDRGARTYRADVGNLPDGVFVEDAEAGSALLLWAGSLWTWSFSGYSRAQARPRGGEVTVLTPRSTVNAITAGYVPQVHPTAIPNHR
jgi:hypothetical protein